MSKLEAFRIHDGNKFGNPKIEKRKIIICKNCHQSTIRLYHSKRVFGRKVQIQSRVGYCEFCDDYTLEESQ